MSEDLTKMMVDAAVGCSVQVVGSRLNGIMGHHDPGRPALTATTSHPASDKLDIWWKRQPYLIALPPLDAET